MPFIAPSVHKIIANGKMKDARYHKLHRSASSNQPITVNVSFIVMLSLKLNVRLRRRRGVGMRKWTTKRGLPHRVDPALKNKDTSQALALLNNRRRCVPGARQRGLWVGEGAAGPRCIGAAVLSYKRSGTVHAAIEHECRKNCEFQRKDAQYPVSSLPMHRFPRVCGRTYLALVACS